jgi:hypothetical protein
MNRSSVLHWYRVGLRYAEKLHDPQCALYVKLRLQERFRAHADCTSPQKITGYLHDARRQIRRLGRALAGDHAANIYVVNLAYAATGRLSHMLNAAPKPLMLHGKGMHVSSGESLQAYVAMVSKDEPRAAQANSTITALSARIGTYRRWRRRLYRDVLGWDNIRPKIKLI